MTSPTISELLPRARAGGAEAEFRLFEGVSERLLTYVRLRLGPELRRDLDSCDILQETFLKAHELAADFEGDDPRAYQAWLCRIAEHRIKKAVEQRTALKRKPAGARLAYSAIVDRLRTSATGPVSAAERSERRRLLFEKIDVEGDETRRMLLQRFFEERSLDEIAAATGRSPTTVRRMIGLAAARLGAELRALEDER